MVQDKEDPQDCAVSQHDKLIFPDPCQALWLHQNVDAQRVGIRWIKQRRLRSRVFAHARSELAEKGLEGIQLRTIARDCEISVQTIYNLVGDRSEVITQSADEWVSALGKAALQRVVAGEISEVIAILGTFWCAPLRSRNFVSNATQSSMLPNSEINRAFRDNAVRLVTESLRTLRTNDQLRASVHIPSLARQLVSTTQMGIYEWTIAPGDIRSYWNEFEHGPALMLLASAIGQETTRIEASLQLIRDACVTDQTRH